MESKKVDSPILRPTVNETVSQTQLPLSLNIPLHPDVQSFSSVNQVNTHETVSNSAEGDASDGSYLGHTKTKSEVLERRLPSLERFEKEKKKAEISTNQMDSTESTIAHPNQEALSPPFHGASRSAASSQRIGRTSSEIVNNGEQAHNSRPPSADLVVTPTMHRLASACYFSYMFGLGAINAYFGYIFSEKGISKSLIGVLASIIPIFSIVALPVFSFLADKYDCAVIMLVVAVSLSIAAVWFYTTASNHPVLIIAYIVLVLLETPVNPLMDRNILVVFAAATKTTKWAFTRSFGAIGWGVGNVLASAVAYWYGTWSMGVIQYTVGHLAMLLCIWLLKTKEVKANAGRYRITDNNTASAKGEKQQVKFITILRIVVRNPRLLGLLLASAAMGMGYSVVNTFLFIFLAEIGGSEILFGITLLLTVSTEIPVFIYFNYIERWLSESTMLSIAMGLWALRVAIYSVIHNPWLVLIVEPLHGITFGLMWLPGVKAVSTAFPVYLSSSATGVLFFFVAGIGSVIGCIVAGTLGDALGSRIMFQLSVIAMVVLLVFYQITDRVLSCLGWSLYPAEEQKSEHSIPTPPAYKPSCKLDNH